MANFIRPWDTNNAMLVQIYSAALAGLLANPVFFNSSIFQGEPDAAVQFADQIVVASQASTARIPEDDGMWRS